MDMFYIPAIASFSGSASGTLASIVTGWVTQRRKDRIRHSLRAKSQREELYRHFIEQASRRYADALVHEQSQVPQRGDLHALLAPIDPRSDVPLDQKVHIRIHTDHKWPERVVLDTTGSTPAHDAKADGETDVAGSGTAVPAERQPFEAFAEMARKGLTLPSRLH